MIRLLSAIVLLGILAGCTAIMNAPAAGEKDDGLSAQFVAGLEKLEQRGDTKPLRNIARKEPETVWGTSSQSILNIYSGQQAQVLSLQKKNSALAEENRSLRESLEKLNQINLELEKRSN